MSSRRLEKLARILVLIALAAFWMGPPRPPGIPGCRGPRPPLPLHAPADAAGLPSHPPAPR